MVTIVYSDRYFCVIGAHVFPAQKYRLVYRMLKKNEKLAGQKVQVLEPRFPTMEELRLVHTEKYLQDVLNARLTPETFSSELPLKRDVIEAFLLSTGGTLVAAEDAVKNGRSINLGGGFHHAFPEHAEGFCFFNDVAIAATKLLNEGAVSRIAVVDCDLHQGNGTAHIFRENKNVFTFSIHQENNYPVKQQSTLDIGLDDGVGDEEYIEKLRQGLELIEKDFKPDYVFYLAGADPFENDQLGGLRLTHAGFRKRDDLVIGLYGKKKIPLCVLLAGGYSIDVQDTVLIHYDTCVRLIEDDIEEA